MGASSWAVPVGVLAAICGVALIFVIWWFPRTWQKGVNADMTKVANVGAGCDDEERQAIRLEQRARNKAIIERALAAEQAKKRGEAVEVIQPRFDEHGNPLKPEGYNPV